MLDLRLYILRFAKLKTAIGNKKQNIKKKQI